MKIGAPVADHQPPKILSAPVQEEFGHRTSNKKIASKALRSEPQHNLNVWSNGLDIGDDNWPRDDTPLKFENGHAQRKQSGGCCCCSGVPKDSESVHQIQASIERELALMRKSLVAQQQQIVHMLSSVLHEIKPLENRIAKQMSRATTAQVNAQHMMRMWRDSSKYFFAKVFDAWSTVLESRREEQHHYRVGACFARQLGGSEHAMHAPVRFDHERHPKGQQNEQWESQIAKTAAPEETATAHGLQIEREYDLLDNSDRDHKITVRKFGSITAKICHKRESCTEDAFDVATVVIENTKALAKMVENEIEMLDENWIDDCCPDIFKNPFGLDSASVLSILCERAAEVVSCEPTLTEVDAPAKVFGDVHGQLRDVLLFFNNFGFPGVADAPTFVFNGDFVDRGKHQLEFMGLLLALKVAYPEKVYLNRGNHEDESMNKKYGFQKECEEKLGEMAAQHVLRLLWNFFNLLPLACLIGGRALVLHGGIGAGNWTLDDLRKLPRPISHWEVTHNDLVLNILWSDPIEEDESGVVFGVHPSRRNVKASNFGWNVTKAFCQKNGLDLVVRSHQAKQDGYGFEVMHDESLIRVFSARDYDEHGNDAAILHLSYVYDESQGQDSKLSVRAQVIRAVAKSTGSQTIPRVITSKKRQVPSNNGQPKLSRDVSGNNDVPKLSRDVSGNIGPPKLSRDVSGNIIGPPKLSRDVSGSSNTNSSGSDTEAAQLNTWPLSNDIPSPRSGNQGHQRQTTPPPSSQLLPPTSGNNRNTTGTTPPAKPKYKNANARKGRITEGNVS